MSRIKALLIFFGLFAVVSIAYLTYASQLPISEQQTTTLCSYIQNGKYNYIANLEPNIIYDNKSSLGPGEGVIYYQITENINITFAYTFESSLDANTTVKYMVSEYLETGRWQKQMLTTPEYTIENTSNRTSFYVDLPQIDTRSVDKLVNDVSMEAGVSIGSYNVTIITAIAPNAETSAGKITEPFTANLTVAFLKGAPEGNFISIENLQTEKAGRITQTQTTYDSWARIQQYASYMLFPIPIIGLLISAFFYNKTKPSTQKPQSEKLIQELVEPYEDIIVEAVDEPVSEGQTAVTVRTLEDLVKTADMLSKPIIHAEKSLSTERGRARENLEPLHVLYVLDGGTRYEYKITQSEMRAVKERVLEESGDE